MKTTRENALRTLRLPSFQLAGLAVLIAASASAQPVAFTCSNNSVPLEVGAAYTTTCTVTGGTGTAPFTWSISAGALPTGVTSGTTANSITLTGPATAGGATSYTVEVTDSTLPVATTATQVFSGTIASAPAFTCSNNNAPLEVGAAYTTTCTVTGGTGTAPFTWSISAGALPAGVTSGTTANSITLTGPATAGGLTNYTVQLSDSLSVTANRAFSGTIASAPAFTCSNNNVPLEVDVAYTTTCTVTGGTGTAPFTWSISAGALPAGVTSGTTANSITLTGPATAGGLANYTVQLSDSLSVTATRAFSGTIAALPTIACVPATTALPDEVGAAYSTTCSVTGGTAAYTWSLGAGSPNLSLNSPNGATVTLSGTPNAAGTFNYALSLTDSLSQASNTLNFSATVASALSATCTPTGTLEVGVAYSVTCSVNGTGVGPYTWSSAGTIPSGLGALNINTGSIGGTLTTVQNAIFSLTVTDSASTHQTSTEATQLGGSIIAGPALSCDSALGPTETEVLYVDECTASGGTPGLAGAYTFSIVNMSAEWQETDAIPASPFEITVSQGASFLADIGVVNAATGVAFTKVVGVPVAGQYSVAPGGVYTFSAADQANGISVLISYSAATLPSPIAANVPNAGRYRVAGTPSFPGPYSYTVQATDNATTPQSVTQVFNGSISAGLAIACTPFAGTAEVGVLYTVTCTATEAGGGTFNWSLSGTAPSGVTLVANGATATISGTLTATGLFSYAVVVHDPVSLQTQQSPNFAGVVVSSLSISCLPAPAAAPFEFGVTQTLSCGVSGGTPPYMLSAFKVGAGAVALPTGVTVNSAAGTVSGMPTVANQTYGFEIQVTDSTSTPPASSGVYSGTVAPAVTVTCVVNAGATEVGVPYSTVCTAHGGLPSLGLGAVYSWSLKAGSVLPPFSGLSLGTPFGPNLNQVAVAGTPTGVTGMFSYTVQAADAVSGLVSGPTVTTQVLNAPGVNCVQTPGSIEVNVFYQEICTAANGTGPFTWTPPTLPANLSGAATGATYTISGRPSAAGALSYTVSVTDGAGQLATATVNGLILATPSITCVPPPPTGPSGVGVAYTDNCTVSGGTAPYNWRISAGALPSGISLLNAGTPTATVSGTPTQPGAYTYTLQVTDSAADAVGGADHQSALNPATFTGTILAPITFSCASSQFVTDTTFPISVSCTVTGGQQPYNFTNPNAASLAPSLTHFACAPNATPSLTTTCGFTFQTQGAVSPVVFTPVVQVTDSSQPVPLPQQTALSVTVNPMPTISCTGAAPGGGPVEVGLSYKDTCTVAGGVGPYTWAVQTSLPSGITLTPLNTTAIIAGVPAVTGGYGYTISVTDSNGIANTNATTFSGNVLPQVSISCTNTSGPAEQNAAYTSTCTASGGQPAYNWSGVLPSGLTLKESADTTTATISGAPTSSGSNSFTVTVADQNIQQATANYSLAVANALAISCDQTTGPTLLGFPYTDTCRATNGLPGYNWSITGTLPAGLTSSSVGASTFTISGTLAAVGPYNYTVSVSDTASPTPAVQSVSFTNGTPAPVLSLTAQPPTSFTVNSAANLTLTVSNATSNVLPGATVVNIQLPAGVTVSQSQNAVTGVDPSWACTTPDGLNITCAQSTSTPLPANGAYAPISLGLSATDQICTTASGQVSYTASASYASVMQATTSLAVNSLGCLLIAKTNTSSFNANGTVNNYYINVTNPTTKIVVAPVTVSDHLSADLAVDPSFSQVNQANGWTCAATQSTTDMTWTATCTTSAPVPATANNGPAGSLPQIILPAKFIGPPASCILISDPATVSLGQAPNLVQQSSSTDSTSISGTDCLAVQSSFKPVSVAAPTVTTSGPATPTTSGCQSPAQYCYSLWVADTGESDVSDTVTLTLPLPSGFTYAAIAGANPAWTCSSAAGTQNVVCQRNPEPATNPANGRVSFKGGEVSLLTIGVTVDSTVPCGVLPGLAPISVLQGTNTPVTFPLAPTAIQTSALACLAISRAQTAFPVAGLTPTPPDGTYTLTVSNPGGTPAPASSVTVTETLPSGVTLDLMSLKNQNQSWDCSGSSQDSASGQWTLSCVPSADIPAQGQAPVITVPYNVTFAACPSILTTAYVLSGGVQQAGTTDFQTMSGCFAISKTYQPNPILISGAPNPTGTAALILSVTYLGQNAQGQQNAFAGTETITDVLTSGISLVPNPTPYNGTTVVNYPASSGIDWSCTASTDVNSVTTLTCTRPAVGTYLPIMINNVNVTAAACSGQAVSDPAALQLDQTLPAGAIAEQTSSGSTPIVGCPNGNLVPKSVPTNSTGLFSPGGTAIYTLTVTNTGTAATANPITVTETFVRGVTISGTVAPQDATWSCTASSSVVICSTTTGTSLASNGTYSISIPVTFGQAACPQATDTLTVNLGGFSIVPVQESQSLTGCITASPTALTFVPTNVGSSSAAQSITLASLDKNPLTVTIAALPATSDFQISDADCKGTPLFPCTVTLNPATQPSTILNVTYTPVCMGSSSDTVNYTNIVSSGAVVSNGSLPLTGTATLTGLTFSQLSGSTSTSLSVTPPQTVQPATSIDIGLTPSAPGYCIASAQRTITPSFNIESFTPTESAVATKTYDESVAACPSGAPAGCQATLQTGTVAGAFKVQATFTDSQKGAITYPTGSPSPNDATVTIPEVAPVLTSISKGAVNGSSFVIGAIGYSTPRVSTQVCFTFAESAGTVLKPLNGCVAATEQELTNYYLGPNSTATGSQFDISVTFSYSGDSSAIGTVDVYLMNAVSGTNTSNHMCLNFKTGGTSSGACQ